MATFHYFAYGSNMLTARLFGRCDSASPITVAKVDGYRLAFSKHSVDGSGKATLVPDYELNCTVYGAVFSIADTQLPTLDDFEGSAYQRRSVPVRCIHSGEEYDATTYFARHQEAGLVPYDWYLALVIAGLEEHRIDSEYTKAVRSVVYETDDKLDRKQRLAAITAFEQADIHDYKVLLTQGAGTI